MLVSLKSTGEIEKTVIASVTESLKADKSFKEDRDRLVEIFKAEKFQLFSLFLLYNKYKGDNYG